MRGSAVPWEGWGGAGRYRGMLSPAPFPFAGEDLVSEQALQIQEADEARRGRPGEQRLDQRQGSLGQLATRASGVEYHLRLR